MSTWKLIANLELNLFQEMAFFTQFHCLARYSSSLFNTIIRRAKQPSPAIVEYVPIEHCIIIFSLSMYSFYGKWERKRWNCKKGYNKGIKARSFTISSLFIGIIAEYFFGIIPGNVLIKFVMEFRTLKVTTVPRDYFYRWKIILFSNYLQYQYNVWNIISNYEFITFLLYI